MEVGAILEALPGMGAHGSVRQQGAPRVSGQLALVNHILTCIKDTTSK
jgi:hypothetical protein